MFVGSLEHQDERAAFIRSNLEAKPKDRKDDSAFSSARHAFR